MKLLRLVNYHLYRFQSVFVVVIFGALLLLAFSQVCLRIFFRSGIEGADTLLRFLVLWVGFLGASLATYKNRHINIDIISQFTRKKSNRAIMGITGAASFIVSGFLCAAASIFVFGEASDTARVFFMPVWVLQSVVPLSFFFMSLRFLQ
ncbi:MAG TPA: TRAP transporter small permease subunit, partial [bacterium]|nr:TRAP transporter small permease subunit [bacterium]